MPPSNSDQPEEVQEQRADEQPTTAESRPPKRGRPKRDQVESSPTDVKKKRSKERVQLDFSTEALNRLDHLKESIDASTRAEVVRSALRLFEWFITETEPEHTITVSDVHDEVITKFKAKLLYGGKE